MKSDTETFNRSGPDEAVFRYPGSTKLQDAFKAGAAWGAVKSVMSFSAALRKSQERDMERAMEGSDD